MSAKLQGFVWDLDIPTNRKIVLLRMAGHAQDDGSRIFPSVAHVVSKTGLGKRTVQAILAELVDAGVLVVVKPGGGRQKSTEYRLDIVKAFELYPPSDEELADEVLTYALRAEVAQSGAEKGRKNGAGAARFRPGNGAGAAPFANGNGAAGARKGAAYDANGARALHPNDSETGIKERARATDDARDVWSAARARLDDGDLTDDAATWLDAVEAIDLTDDELILRTPTRLFADHVKKNFGEAIETSVGRPVRIIVGSSYRTARGVAHGG